MTIIRHPRYRRPRYDWLTPHAYDRIGIVVFVALWVGAWLGVLS